MSDKTLREAAERVVCEEYDANLNYIGPSPRAVEALRDALADSADAPQPDHAEYTKDEYLRRVCGERPKQSDAPEGPWDEKKAGRLLYDVVRGEGNWENLTDDERLKWIVMSRNYRYLNRLDAQQGEQDG